MIASLALAAAFAAPQHPSTASLTLADERVTPHDVTVALGATVTFDYPTGTGKHNVNFERSGPECGQLAGASAGAQGRILPPVPEGPGWVVRCAFGVPGVYHFGSDEHGSLIGIVRVANADGTVPPDTGGPSTTPTPQEPYVPGVNTNTSGGGKNQAAGGKVAATWSVAASQRRSLRVTLTGGSERGRIVLEAHARRGDLRAKGKASLVRVGRVTKTVGAGARVTVSVPLNAKAKAALKRLKRMKVTVRVTVAGKTSSKTVTLRSA